MVSIIFLLFFVAEFVCSEVFFAHIKYYCFQKHRALVSLNIIEQESFYTSFKKAIQCPNFLVSLAGGLLISVSETFL